MSDMVQVVKAMKGSKHKSKPGPKAREQKTPEKKTKKRKDPNRVKRKPNMYLKLMQEIRKVLPQPGSGQPFAAWTRLSTVASEQYKKALKMTGVEKLTQENFALVRKTALNLARSVTSLGSKRSKATSGVNAWTNHMSQVRSQMASEVGNFLTADANRQLFKKASLVASHTYRPASLTMAPRGAEMPPVAIKTSFGVMRDPVSGRFVSKAAAGVSTQAAKPAVKPVAVKPTAVKAAKGTKAKKHKPASKTTLAKQAATRAKKAPRDSKGRFKKQPGRKTKKADGLASAPAQTISLPHFLQLATQAASH
jgi:hypothetical protein